jgi:hypothetical protein
MPQSQSQKTINTFIKGLITEAGELTFPPDASVDELNCDLRRDGSRRRRKGAIAEDNSVLSTFTVATTDLVHTGTWLNVGGQAGLEYLVIQTGATLRFYNKASSPYSGNQLTQTVNLATYEVVGSVGAANVKCQFASLKGALIVASPAIETIYIERDNITEVLSVNLISFKIRDFEWQGTKADYSTGIATGSITDVRKYDTYNSGWVDTKGAAALATYIAANTEYPPLNLPWYAGKDASGDFSVTEWEKIYSGTSLIGNGHYILNFFSKDRTTASGIAGLPTETETSRFKSVAAFAGRVFYAGLQSSKNSGSILFSPLIDNLGDLGLCYQINDPTSEDISDLLDTDGGRIVIPDAVNIKYLYAYGANLYIFADNGVWSINGVDNVFRATEYSIQSISSVGILSAETFVEAEGIPFWWSKFGIHALTFDQVSGLAKEENISVGTIQTFWDDISQDSKSRVTALYDRINKEIYWAYPEDGETNVNKFNKFLILDTVLQAFYPWTISDEATNTDYIMGFSFYSGFGSDQLILDVVSAADDVISNSDDVISTQYTDYITGDPAIVLLIRDGATGKVTMGTFSSSTYLDWGTTNYSSYAEAGYDFKGDLFYQKTSPYVITYMRTTETGWTGDEIAGYEPINPSSLFVSSFWDFKSTPSSVAQQAYRFKTMPVVGDLNTWDYPSSVISTRLKLRGKGRSTRLRFESEQGKDFILLGYGVIDASNQRY